MADELPEVKPDPKPEDLAQMRIPDDRLSPTEREVFVGRINELEAENTELRKENEKLRNPSPSKKKSALERWCPL